MTSENFLILRLSSLGDIIHTLPAFSALRKTFAGSRITWLVGRPGKKVLELVPAIDEVVVLGEKGWLKKIRNMNQVALDFQGLLKTGFLSILSGSGRRLGFRRKNLKEPLASLFYSERPRLFSEEDHVIRKNLGLLECLGIREERFEFPIQIPESLRNGVRKKLEGLGFDGKKKIVLYNVGASWKTKRWLPENWAGLIESLKKEDALGLILWGTEEEKRLASEISAKTGVRALPFLNLQEVMTALKESSLLISGDTFALQAACALGRPVVGIFGPTNPQRNGPFNLADPVAFHRLECSFCYSQDCESIECLKKISVEEVAGLASRTLGKNV